MRILHVVPTYLPATRYGGPIYSVHGLSKSLAALNHEVDVYTTNVDGPVTSPVPLGLPVAMNEVRVHYFPTSMGRRLYRSPELGRTLARTVSNFDLIHLHSVFLWPTTVAARLAIAAKKPYVLSPRGMLVEDLIKQKSRLAKTAWLTLFERRNLRCAAAVHATSDVERTEIERMGFSTRQIAVIPNGIDAAAVAQSANRTVPKSNLEEGRPYVLCLGRINWKKGLDRLIEAMTAVPDANLVIAGNDEEGYQPQLRALAERLGVAGRVIFSGPVSGDEKWALIRSAAIFALPSLSENFGNAVLEAMACSRPIVVTPAVGLASDIARVGAGRVVDGDPRHIGTAIASLLADPELRKAMGAAGRALALEKFSWSAVAEDMEQLYRSCLGRQGDAVSKAA
ncbi:MAG: glycosyltransferase [Hyphomicrobium sp.]